LAEKLRYRKARHSFGVLEGQEKARLASDVWRPGSDVLAFKPDGASGHMIRRVAEDYVRECRLARAVRAHQSVKLAGVDNQVDTSQDRYAVYLCVEPFDLQKRTFHARHTITTTAVVENTDRAGRAALAGAASVNFDAKPVELK
jgi:hypothetical protein